MVAKKKVKKAKVDETKDGLDLAVVGEGENEESKYGNKEIRDKILRLLAETEDKNWDLAVVLETAYDEDMYRDWGFDSFREYVEKELQIHIRKAQFLVQLQEWFKKMPANIQQWMRGLGWTKARMLMHIVTVENASEWRNKVAGKSVVEIDKMLKDAKGEGGGGGDGEGDEGGEEKPKPMNFKLFPEQHKNVSRALEKAGEISGSEKPGNNLDLICTEYLGTNAGIESIQDVFRKMEKNLGVRLIAYVEEDDSVAYGAGLIEELESRDKGDGTSENAEYDGDEPEE